MPTIARLGPVAIRLFADDHNPPHFHVVTVEQQAMIRLDDLEMIGGELNRVHLELAPEWARTNRGKLQDEWKRLNER